MDIPPSARAGRSSTSGGGTRAELASEAELEAYSRAVSSELDRAEAELSAPRSRPFGGLGHGVLGDVSRLRAEQFDMFRRHVAIEQQYRVASPLAEPHVRAMSFSAIADTMREKESATASLLNRLAEFDNDLRHVIATVESNPKEGGGASSPDKTGGAGNASGGSSSMQRSSSYRRRAAGSSR